MYITNKIQKIKASIHSFIHSSDRIVGFKKATTLKKSDWEDVLGSWGKEMPINFYTIGPREKKCFLLLEISVTD